MVFIYNIGLSDLFNSVPELTFCFWINNISNLKAIKVLLNSIDAKSKLSKADIKKLGQRSKM